MNSKIAFGSLLSLSVGLAVATASKVSEAATYVNCAVAEVGYEQNHIRIKCSDGIWYQGKVYIENYSSCQRPNDTLKTWVSLAEAALLSGKPLAIGYETCGNERYPTEIILKSSL